MKLSTKTSKERIQVCPQCGSPDIQTDFSDAGRVATGVFNVMKCNHCKHEGTFFPTVNKKQLTKPLPKKQVKNVKRFDKTFARGYSAYFLGTGGLFSILASIISFAYDLNSAGFALLILGIILSSLYFNSRKK
ncbi:MAG: hypothetical protein KC506_02055 [Nanoarchaeota archaeon]|nr:hypothetical protein [Nanoarchaeota archaeon]